MSKASKPVSVRVPEDLPAKIRAVTGMSFSKAIVTFFVPLVESMERKQREAAAPKDTTHD